MAVDVSNSTVKIQGFDELARKLRAIPDAMRKKVVRNALAAGGRLVRDAARREAPVLAQETPYRTPGLLRRSIVVRTSKRDRLMGNVGVFINVRPAKGAKFKTTTRKVFGVKVKSSRMVRASQRGAKSKLDPFYWRFQEFGWTPATGPRGNAGKRARRKAVRSGAMPRIPGKAFLQKSGAQLPKALEIFKTQLGRWIERTNRTGRVVP